MRALLVYYAWGLQLIRCLMHNTYELLLPLTKLFLCFQNKSSSTKIAIHAYLCEGPFFYFYVESVYLLLSILEANTCVNCVHWFLHVYLLHLLYCFMVTTIHEIYMLQVESNCWNLIILCVASKPLTLNLLLYELPLTQNFLMLVLKVLFMKSFCLYDSLFTLYLFVSKL